MDARSEGGDLVFRDVGGPIEARTTAGAIHVAGCGSDVDLVTTRGSIGVQNVAGEVSAHGIAPGARRVMAPLSAWLGAWARPTGRALVGSRPI